MVTASSKLLVFDLDLTLWPFRLDKQMKSPFQLLKGGKVIDCRGTEVNLMDETLATLNFLQESGYLMGIASRIEDICGAYQLINLLGLAPYFDHREIYPGCKKKHFNSLHQKSQVNFENMIFFDDDLRNIRDVSNLGVTAIHVPDGIKKSIVKEAVQSQQ